MRNSRNKEMKASITIEASFIIPFITIIIVLIIYLSFFVYNRCIITQKLYSASLQGSLSELDKKDIEQDMKNEIIKMSRQSVIGGNLSIRSSQVDGEIICNETVFQLKHPFYAMAKSEGIQSSWIINTHKEIEIINSVEYIRNIRRIEQIRERIK